MTNQETQESFAEQNEKLIRLIGQAVVFKDSLLEAGIKLDKIKSSGKKLGKKKIYSLFEEANLKKEEFLKAANDLINEKDSNREIIRGLISASAKESTGAEKRAFYELNAGLLLMSDIG